MGRLFRVVCNLAWISVPPLLLLRLIAPWWMAGAVAAVGVAAGAGLWHWIAAPVGVRLLGAKPLPKTREWTPFFDQVEEDARSLGIRRPPRLYFLQAQAANALAFGHPGRSAVVLTVPLLSTLDFDQLRAVVGHELAHVRNQDGYLLLLNIVSAWLTRALSLAVRVAALVVAGVVALAMGLAGLVSARLTEDVNGLGRAVGQIVDRATAWFFNSGYAVLMALSRDAESRADLSGARVAGPENMASALAVVDALNTRVEPDGWLDRRFRSHPPTSERVQALLALGSPTA